MAFNPKSLDKTGFFTIWIIVALFVWFVYDPSIKGFFRLTTTAIVTTLLATPLFLMLNVAWETIQEQTVKEYERQKRSGS